VEEPFIDYYALLGLPFGCTAEQIEAACLALGQMHRPDRENVSETDKRKFALIEKAYETLRDPEQRETYDRRYLDQSIASRQDHSAHSARRPAHQTEGIWTIAAAVALPILSALLLEIDWAPANAGFFTSLYFTDFRALPYHDEYEIRVMGHWIDFNALQLLLVSLLLITWGVLTLLRVAPGPWSVAARVHQWYKKKTLGNQNESPERGRD